MKIEIIRDVKGFFNLKDEWEILEKEDINTSYFNTFEYNYLWLKNMKETNLYTITVRDNNNDLFAIAPLHIEIINHLFLQLKILKFMAWGDYQNIILKNKDINKTKVINTILNEIKKEDKLWDRVFLGNIDINTELSKTILKNQEFNKYFELQVECPKLYFNKYDKFDDYKIDNLSKSTKKQRNKMIKELKYKFVVENNNKNNRFEEISKIHKELQKNLVSEDGRKERKSLYENKERYNFLFELYKNSNDIINFILLDKNGEIIIYDTCYFYNGVLYSWNMAHNVKYKKYNPGRVINFEIINYCFNNNIKIFDFGCGRYSWKFEWTPDLTSVYKLEFYTNNSRNVRAYKKLKELKKGIRCFLNILKK